MKKNKIVLFIVHFTLFFCIGVITLISVETITSKKEIINIIYEDVTDELLDRRSFEQGKSIGRNAMLQYILANTDDTLSIKILDLLALEDTLSKNYKFR